MLVVMASTFGQVGFLQTAHEKVQQVVSKQIVFIVV